MTKTENRKHDGTDFVLKDIVKKKKNPQQKLDKYFVVTKKAKFPKAEASPVEKNFQGFPLTECVYESTVEKYVCRPVNYYRNKDKETIEKSDLCCECYLRPCLLKDEVGQEMLDGFHTVDLRWVDKFEAWSLMQELGEKVTRDVFGNLEQFGLYGVPSCVLASINRVHGVMFGLEEHEKTLDPKSDPVGAAIDRNLSL